MTISAAVFALAGLSALMAALLPRWLHKKALSVPMAFLALGLAVGFVPGTPEIDPLLNSERAEHVTEVVVIIALMGAGISIDRAVGWKRWRTTWQLLAIAMPLTILLVAVTASWVAGLPLAAAVLVGAVLAPTDPVLAGDVQVGRPSEDENEDEVRFSLTSEAGLNDGAAFPAVHLALVLAAGTSAAGLAQWAADDLVLRSVLGVVVGVAVGWLLGKLFYRYPLPEGRLADQAEGFTALAVTFLAYGIAEGVHGYGFVAVFVAAVTLRSFERSHGAHRVAHSFIDQVERILTAWVLLLLGMAIADGLLAALTWQLALVGVLLIFLIRPVVGALSTFGNKTPWPERLTIAFFGVRGIGSLYYLAYALGKEEFPGEELWALVGFTVLLSVVVHGALATPVVRRLDATRARNGELRGGEHQEEESAQ